MNTKNCLLLIACLGASCLLFSLTVLPGRAQEHLVPEYAPKLDQTIHLTLGKTTLSAALAALSQQTGIRIDAAESLKERDLVVQMEGLTGRTALNALTALNDLKWREIGPNHLLVDRPTPKRPEKITEVPGQFVAALPKDVRDFLLIGMPSDKAWEFAEPNAFPKRKDFEFSQFLDSRASGLYREQNRLLEAALPAKLTMGTKIPFRTMTAAQQSELLTMLFLDAITHMSASLLRDNLAPFQKDVMQASLHLHKSDGILEIGTVTQEGDTASYRFFGAPIAPPAGAQDLSGKNP
jgi:hypothetical protein